MERCLAAWIEHLSDNKHLCRIKLFLIGGEMNRMLQDNITDGQYGPVFESMWFLALLRQAWVFWVVWTISCDNRDNVTWTKGHAHQRGIFSTDLDYLDRMGSQHLFVRKIMLKGAFNLTRFGPDFRAFACLTFIAYTHTFEVVFRNNIITGF